MFTKMIKCYECKYWKSDNGLKGNCNNYALLEELVHKGVVDSFVFIDAYHSMPILGTDWNFQCKYGEVKCLQK